MMLDSTRSISFKTQVVSTVIAAIILSFSGYFVIYLAKGIVYETRSNNLKVVKDTILKYERNRLFAYQEVQTAQDHIDNWLKLYNLDFVYYEDGDQRFFATNTDLVSFDESIGTQEAFDVELGDKQIRISMGYYNRDLTKLSVYFIMFSSVVMLILLILVWITNRYATNLLKPVYDAIYAIRNYRPGGSIDLEVFKNMAQPEMQEVIESFAEMQSNVQTAEKERAEALEKEKAKDKLLQRQSQHIEITDTISNIAHQWKQPLSIVSTAVAKIRIDLIFGELKQDSLSKTISTIEAQADFMSNTIDSFLSFFSDSRDESASEFYVEDTIRIVKGLLESKLSNSKISLQYPVGEQTKAFGRKADLEQVLFALVSNAINAINENKKENSRQINVRVNEDVERQLIRVVVEDTGGGIPKKIQPEIFKAYYTSRQAQDGTGLGLYIVKSLVETSLGGTVEVENTQDGARFTLIFGCKGCGDT